MNEAFALRDVMRREFVGVGESDTLEGTVSLLAEEGAECAVVLRGSDPVGLVTPSVINEAIADDVNPKTQIAMLMDDAPPVMGPADRFEEAASRLGEGGPRAIVVADEDGVVGLLTATQALDAIAARIGEAANPEPGTVAATAGAETDDDEYARQSVCEGCGSLAADLTAFNGQLLCPDCRDV
jgi:CBS domain-containing protein